jgi:hypothetical protein
MQNVTLNWNEAIPVSMHLSDSFGMAGEKLANGFRLAAHGSLYVRVERNE